jgi:hypothetical protein
VLGAALLVQQRHLFAQLVQACIGFVAGGVGGFAVFLQLGQALGVRRGQALALGGQALAAGAQRAGLLVEVAAFGGQQLDLLLHLGDLAALLVGLGLRGAHGIFELRR